MLKIKTLLSVAVAVTGVALAANCYGQHCSSCAQAAQFAPVQVAPVQVAPVQVAPIAAAPIQVGSPCNSCGPGPVAIAPVQQVSFAAPSRGCAGCLAGGAGAGGLSSKINEAKAKCAHCQAINARIQARNNAWPKPFACADRQLYHSFFEPMIDQGWEEQCVLTASHFDEESGQLNKFGQTAIAGIMQNNPNNRRVVFIHRDVNDAINQQRRSEVENTINTFYGHTATAQVAFSNKRPVTTSGPRAAQLQQQWLGNQAVPAIAVSSGESVSEAVTQ